MSASIVAFALTAGIAIGFLGMWAYCHFVRDRKKSVHTN